MKFEVHIGHKIKEVVHDTNISVKEFSSKINKSRTVVYSIFERRTVDTELLKKISEVLKHDFFQYYCAEGISIAREAEVFYSKQNPTFVELQNELQTCKKELFEMKEKYELLKKINKLLEERTIRQ